MPMRNSQIYSTPDPIQLEVFKHLFSAIAEEMGAVLRKASFSPNIKERRDFSCALFDANGQMVAQAAHIPVHLGSMPLSVAAAIEKFDQVSDPFQPGDMVILNDPFLGGTHLPDITLVSPVFIPPKYNEGENTKSDRLNELKERPYAYVACRAHHSDVGGISPGSMPIAREIFQEGLIIPPIKLFQSGVINQGLLDLILSNVRTPEERAGDLQSQIGANLRGQKLLLELIQRYSAQQVSRNMHALQDYTEKMTRQLIATLPDGEYSFHDFLDDNGISPEAVMISVSIKIDGDNAIVDFTGSAPQQPGSVNAVYAITLSAVNYVFRALMGLDVPNNSGCLVPIQVIAPAGSIVNANHPAPVAGGNVETSQRIVDVLLGALAQACPSRIPAASQGTMNNLTIGGWDPDKKRYFTYYETIGGGTGASQSSDGASAVHSHMTNTLNTPIEALEYSYPLQVTRYAIRPGSGGNGTHQGGDGIIREIKLLSEAQVTLLTERRRRSPYGLNGGDAGKVGINQLIHHGINSSLPGKGSVNVEAGDSISIHTPGGGGYGRKEE